MLTQAPPQTCSSHGCGGSKPIDPAEYIVPQSEPEEPMLVRLTSCAGNFVELSSSRAQRATSPSKTRFSWMA